MKRTWAIVAAAVLGLLAVVLTNVYLQRQKPPPEEMTSVLVAASEITKGAVIEHNMLVLQPTPVKFVQPGALRAREIAVGKTAMVTIMAGEQILATKLAQPEAGLTLAGKTPPGKRAFALGLEPASAVGGFIRPGDHVDVLAIFTAPVITITLFQDVLVLAVGKEMVAEEEKKGGGDSVSRRESVTLALTPQEVQIISVAIEQGKIRLTLRPRQEEGKAMPAVDLSQLPPAVDINTLLQFYIRRAVEPQPSVEVIRGLKKEITPLPR